MSANGSLFPGLSLSALLTAIIIDTLKVAIGRYELYGFVPMLTSLIPILTNLIPRLGMGMRLYSSHDSHTLDQDQTFTTVAFQMGWQPLTFSVLGIQL